MLLNQSSISTAHWKKMYVLDNFYNITCLVNIFEKTFFKRIQDKNNSDVTKQDSVHALTVFRIFSTLTGALKASKLRQNITTEWAVSPVTIP